MRTSIFMGLIYIGDCIAPSHQNTQLVLNVFSIALVVFACMDIIDFMHRRKS